MAILQQYSDLLLRGRVSVGYTYFTGLAKMDIAPGSASLAPLRVTPGTLLSSTVSGAIENDGDNLYWTDSDGVRSPLLSTVNYSQYGLSVLQASRLSTGRYIGIGGGVTAEASQFNGESDLILQVSSVNADYLVGSVPIDALPTGTTSSTVALGNHMHLYAGSASAGGPATTALACTGSSGSVANALTVGTGISLNSGTTYDGSSAKTISINQGFTPTWTGKHIFTGGIQANDLTASRAVVTDGSKNLVSSTVTSEQIGFLSAVTSSVQEQLDGKLGLISGGTVYGATSFRGIVSHGRDYYNVLTFSGTVTVTFTEILIKTRIPYINGNIMPVIRIFGYAYGEASPIDLNIAFYIYGGNFYNMGCMTACPWGPVIKLFTYDDSGTTYVGVALMTSIYYPRFSVSYQDIWAGDPRGYATGWTIETNTTATSIVPSDNLTTVPYRTIANNAATATKLANSRNFSISGGATASAVSFNGTGDVVLNVTSLNASNLSSGTVPIGRLPTGTTSTTVAFGDHTHSYSPTSHASSATTYGLATASLYGHAMASSATPLVAGTASVGTDNGKFAREDHVHPVQTSVSGSSGSCTGNAATATSAGTCTGNAATATKLAAQVAISIGGSSNNFDGSSDLEWTLVDIGASEAGHTHPYLPLSGGTLTGKLTLGTGGSIYKADWDSNVIPYFVSGEMVVNPDVTISSFAPMSHASSDTLYGVSGVGVYGHAQASATVPKANSGVGSVGIETSAFARGDHYHPVVCSVLQASRLSTGRYIGIGGGVTAEASQFNGESDLILQVSSVHAEYLTGVVPIDVLPVGSGSGQVAAGDHTHTGYLSISGGTVSGALTVNGLVTTGSGIQVNANNTDHYLTFNYLGSSGGEAEGTYSWRIGYLGTGSGDANYLVIESSQTSGTWTRAVQYGLITLDATHYGSILPASGVTKNLGSSTQRWNYLYANNVSATTFTGNGAEITDLSASNLTGQVPVSNGGTGRDTLTQNALLLGNATSAIGMLSIGGANTFLKSTGSGYEWVGIRKNDSSEISSLSTSKESPTAITYVSGDNKVYHLQCTAPTNDQVFYVNLPDLNNVVSGDKLEFTLTRTSGVYDAQVVFNPNTATAIFRLGRSTVAGTSERIRIGTGEAIVFYALYSGQAGLSWRVMRYVDMEV